MKVSAFIVAASLASASAFVPIAKAPVCTQLNQSFFDTLLSKPKPEEPAPVSTKPNGVGSLFKNFSSQSKPKSAAKAKSKATSKVPVSSKPDRSFNLFAKKFSDQSTPKEKENNPSARKSPIKFSTIANLDLWAPVSDSNEYGGRKKKNLKTGTLTDKSYVPTGLTRAQYEKIRKDTDTKKAANYQKNVAKAGVFENYTEFYMKRGSDENGSWMKLPNLGHRMAKTKYDWSTSSDNPGYDGDRKK